MMRDYVVSEFEFTQMHLHELTIPERAMLLKSLVRYGAAHLAPENDSGEDISPIIIKLQICSKIDTLEEVGVSL
jgi:hypothetical protein